MNSPSAAASPKYKNLNHKPKQSPQELKEKMRKNYKDKVHNCRGMLMDRLRGSLTGPGVLSKTLTDLYKDMFHQDNEPIENDELEILEEIRHELIQEELEWCMQEYEKSQIDSIDWSAVEQNDDVICPICEKSNLSYNKQSITCSNCLITINTNKTPTEIKKSIQNCIEKHSPCTQEPQFTLINELNESHIYLVCESCTEMSYVV